MTEKLIGKKIRVRVTKEHIAEGTPENCWKCPIALATRDALWTEFGDPARELNVRVGGTTISVCEYGDEDRVHTRLPGTANEFVIAFDSAWPVGEIEFELGPFVKHFPQIY